jgi:hypothetical protein
VWIGGIEFNAGPGALFPQAGCLSSFSAGPRTERARIGSQAARRRMGWEGMRRLAIGDVTITSIIERDGPWRRPEDMFPAYDPAIGKRHLAELDPEVFDPASGRMVITYQTYVVRTGKHTILVDTCTGEDKGYAAPMDFPKKPWLDGFAAAGLRFEDIDYVFCTHPGPRGVVTRKRTQELARALQIRHISAKYTCPVGARRSTKPQEVGTHTLPSRPRVVL